MNVQKLLLFVLTALLLTSSVFAITIDSARIADVSDYGFFSQYSELEIQSQSIGISSVELEITDSTTSTVVEQESYSGDDTTSFTQTLSIASSLTDNTEYDLTITVTGTDASTQVTKIAGAVTDLTSPTMQETTIPSEDSWYTTGSIDFEYEVDDNAGSGTLRSSINLVAEDDTASSVSEVVTSETTSHSASFDASEMSEGTYSILILARDNVGNYANDRIDRAALYIDRTSPTLSWTTAQDTEFETYSPTLEVEVSDNLASQLICDFYINGELASEDGTVTVGSAEIELGTMSPGDYEAYAICEDEALNSQTGETLRFSVLDISEPTISINEPTISTIAAADGITELDIAFTVDDDVAVTDMSLTVTDSVQTQTLSTTQVSTGSFEATLDLSLVEESELQITVTASDAAANTAVDFTTVTYDLTAPTVTFVTADEGTSNDGNFDVTFIPQDNVATDLACALHSGQTGDDTTLYDFGTFASGDEATISITGIEVTSEYSYYIACADDVENAASSSTQTFTVEDITAPTISFDSPSDGNSFDASGSSMTATVTVTDDFYLVGSTVTGTITDTEGQELGSITATDIGSDQFEFTFDFAGQADGWYTVTVTAQDFDENQGSASIQVGYDVEAPTVELTAPETIEQYSDMQFTITGTDTIATTLSCTLYLDDSASALYGAGVGNIYTLLTQSVTSADPSSFEITQSIWDSVIGEQPNVGTHSFYAECTDESSLTGSSTASSVSVQEAGPVVTITSPTDLSSVGQSYVDGTDTLIVTVEADDMIGSILFVELVINSDTLNNIPVMTDNGDGTYSYDLTDIVGLSDEEITLTAIAYDDRGDDAGSESITLLVDTTNPVVSIVEPALLASSDSNTITVSVTDASIYTVVVSHEDGTVLGTESSTTLAQESVDVTYDTSAYADEYIIIRFTVTDAAGNTGEYIAELWVDATAPTISAFTCNGITQGASTDCTCTASDDETSVGHGSTVLTSVSADTSSTGTVTAICTATDSQGNEATSETTFTVSAPVTSSSSGGGGGGGGSSTRAACNDNRDNDGDGLVDMDDPGCQNANDNSEEDVVCRESWICNDWSICSTDGSQERSCYDSNACASKLARGQADRVIESAMPDEVRSCTVIATQAQEQTSEETDLESSQEESTDSGNSITGAVTGGFLGNAKGLAIPAAVLAGVGIVAGAVYAFKKRK